MFDHHAMSLKAAQAPRAENARSVGEDIHKGEVSLEAELLDANLSELRNIIDSLELRLDGILRNPAPEKDNGSEVRAGATPMSRFLADTNTRVVMLRVRLASILDRTEL